MSKKDTKKAYQDFAQMEASELHKLLVEQQQLRHQLKFQHAAGHHDAPAIRSCNQSIARIHTALRMKQEA